MALFKKRKILIQAEKSPLGLSRLSLHEEQQKTHMFACKFIIKNEDDRLKNKPEQAKMSPWFKKHTILKKKKNNTTVEVSLQSFEHCL